MYFNNRNERRYIHHNEYNGCTYTVTTDVVLCVGLSVLKSTYQFPRLPSYNKNVIFSATNGMSFSKEIHVECSIDINRSPEDPITRTVSVPVSVIVMIKVVPMVTNHLMNRLGSEPIQSFCVNLTVTVTETRTERVRVNGP